MARRQPFLTAVWSERWKESYAALSGDRQAACDDAAMALIKQQLSPHCPEIQGCIRCGVCQETPNPGYALPDKWKHLGTSPLYLRSTPAATS